MINKRFREVLADYREIAHNIGEYGLTFATASFYNRRTSSDFKEERLFALDFDSGITFAEVKARLDFHHIPVLFAYKTFSWEEEYEKFRVVIGLDHIATDLFTAQAIILVLMEIFPECDKACKDPARMFFGGKGLLYLNENDEQLSYEQLFLSFDEYMRNKYGQKHYTEHLKKFYQKYRIATDKKDRIPVIEVNEVSGRNVLAIKSEAVNREFCQNSVYDGNISKRRIVVKNFDWNTLYNCCQLYRNFTDGTEYYYYPELFHIALNLCCVDGGRKKFMEILNSAKNKEHDSYFERDWKSTLNDIIKHEYLPKNCNNCPYAENCSHGTNMISTANPSSHEIKILEHKNYCTLEEAELSLKENFYSALSSHGRKIKIITASYLNVRELPYNEIILMSATANPELYKLMMPDRDIQVYKCKGARYTGKIVQYTDNTYSRGNINRNSEIIEKLKTECTGYEVITFAEIEHIFGTKYHFGGIEGLDILKGKNLCIVGTPNVNDVVYKLYGMKIGLSCNELKSDMKKLRVQHSGYDFSLYTYENPIMQTIQIWFIESLLEQAVGRARILRYDCEVKVYSGFPVAQAKFVSL